MMERRRLAFAGALLLACLASLVALSTLLASNYDPEETELLLKVHLAAHEPYSPPANMYLWWGDTTNHRFVGSGEHIRHLLAMGTIEGGEWRDPMFLGNNGVATFRSQRFRRISEACCSTIVMPPFEWDFPVYNVHKIIGQRIRNFVANGNMLVLTGGIMAVEFINAYFFYNIELVDGNYSPGPFHRLPDVPEEMKSCPRVLPQKGIAVTAVKKESLPSGAQVLWGTPRSSAVFMIKFCEAQNEMDGMPPVKVLPRDCPAAERDGRPCSCGHIIYIGYNYQEQYPTRYDSVLRAAVEILSPANLAKSGQATSKLHSLNDWQEVAVDEGRERSVTKSKGLDADSGSSAPDADKATDATEQQLVEQKGEINHLQKMIHKLKKERSYVHDFTAKARTSSLDQLKGIAHQLVGEIRDAEGERREREAREQHSGEGHIQKLVIKSVASLAQDVRKMDARVDSLAQTMDNDDDASEGRRHHHDS